MKTFKQHLNESITYNNVYDSHTSKLPATPENLKRAKAFVFEKWKERAVERGAPAPTDLSYSCKFSSLFVQRVFGGTIAGNYDHQYNIIDGEKVDINEDSKDVQGLDDPHEHDDDFFGSEDHLDSLNSCVSRVNKWVEEFMRGAK
jgi:hypothetical protein